MDAVSALLDGPHARGAFLLRSLLSPPWSMRIADEAPLTLLAVLHGSAWVVLADGRTERIGAGDVALVRGPQHYTVADEPSTPPQVSVGPGQECAPVGSGTGMAELGTRAWGNDAAGGTVLLTGTYPQPLSLIHI